MQILRTNKGSSSVGFSILAALSLSELWRVEEAEDPRHRELRHREEEGAEDRDILAKSAIEKALKTEPAPFMSKRFARLVTPGNIDDHLAQIADVDWIIEVVIERLDIKSALYKKIDAVRKPGTLVSSNTSTIPLKDLVEGQSDGFKADFLITHFFNPPRYLRLLEIVAGPESRQELVDDDLGAWICF